MASETRVISGVSKTISYEYNLDGSLSKLHYPSGRVVTYTPDIAGRVIVAADNNGTQYVSSATYFPNGSEYQRSMPGIYFSTTSTLAFKSLVFILTMAWSAPIT